MNTLFPYPLPDSDIVDDYIEEYQVSEYSSKKSDKESIDNLLFFTFYMINRTNSFGSKVPNKSDSKRENTKSSKVPFILSIKCI
jgi:hypothetical protein